MQSKVLLAYKLICLLFVTVFQLNQELSIDLKENYIATRFSVEEDAWPPEQLKEYTTLALIHHKNQP